MTPQPQPAAYWIELLEELTGGIPFETEYWQKFHPTQLSTFFMLYTSHWDRGFYDCMRQEIDYIQSGQNVIDAALNWKNGYQTNDLADKLSDQTSLYLRCNGIKR